MYYTLKHALDLDIPSVCAFFGVRVTMRIYEAEAYWIIIIWK